jgi:hypothetical protein
VHVRVLDHYLILFCRSASSLATLSRLKEMVFKRSGMWFFYACKAMSVGHVTKVVPLCAFCFAGIWSHEVASIFSLLAKQIAATYKSVLFFFKSTKIFSDIFSTLNRVISEV